MLRIIETDAGEAVGIKLGRVGGLSVARRIRDLCMEAGIRTNIWDTGGTALQASAVVHRAQTTPEPLRRATWICYDRLPCNPVEGGVVNGDGWAVAGDGPGIGAHPDEAALGDPTAVHTLDS
ncbi:MAG: hypothetical protein F4110_01430 [Acidimicrobiaceae bacterium]|nr:hypothetical protein [Acidimicrobiaceae bacterium]MYE95922.1 hypothetical protein [Acidimicrobiaceae bacterium]MYI52649.1 hypothetical protein [Acidimicrobiaceae bacterium]MYJ41563.1 hypothetical protein [Acidimicrobiaceae bacterium]MYJ82337.1 hypothetical protein [Acidimicrobiaceae bacterium]